jgi:SAM-dependent methyltransferase
VESFRAILVAARAVVGRRPETTNASPPVVVDFGCGTGNLLLPLAAAEPSMRFVGVDVNRRSVELLAERAARAGLTNVDAVCGLAETYDGTCDVALALHVCGAGTDAVLLQAQARGAAFVVAPCCVGKLKDGGLKSISAMKKDVLDQTGKTSASGEREDDGILAFSGGEDSVLVRPGKSHAPITVIHPRSSWMRGRIQRPAYLGLAAAADWSGHQGVDPLSNSEQSKALGRFPRDAKAAVELDRGAAAAEAGYGVRVMKMAHEGAGLKNDLIVGFPKGADPLFEFVEGPEACFR